MAKDEEKLSHHLMGNYFMDKETSRSALKNGKQIYLIIHYNIYHYFSGKLCYISFVAKLFRTPLYIQQQTCLKELI